MERTLQMAGHSDANVLITGATGTGKSTLAQMIHGLSSRSTRSFTVVNLASMHEGTIESQLFGHERGAFTGADQRRIGKLETANRGTVFLDEIGELSLPLQARLLEFLQSGSITRLGSHQSIQLDVRVICATHKNLEKEVQAGRFREDLFYRIRVITIETPRLIDLGSSFDQILHRILEEVCVVHRKSILRISEDVAERFENYNWPGNYRELKNVLEYAVISASGTEITLSDLPAWFLRVFSREKNQENPIRILPLERTLSEVWDAAEVPLYFDYLKMMRSFESAYLRYMLARHQGKLSRTAKNLGMSKTTLFRRVRDLELRTESF